MLRSIIGSGVEDFCWVGGQALQKGVDCCPLVLVLRVIGVYDIVGNIVTFEQSRRVRD